MLDYIINFEWNGLLGILLYWAPLLLCFCGYSARTWANYQKDVKERDENEYYYPTDTIGILLGRVFMTIFPVLNLGAAVFDVSPKLFKTFFDWLGKTFDVPLVPKRKKEGKQHG